MTKRARKFSTPENLNDLGIWNEFKTGRFIGPVTETVRSGAGTVSIEIPKVARTKKAAMRIVNGSARPTMIEDRYSKYLCEDLDGIVRRIIPPSGVEIQINGEMLLRRLPVQSLEVYLMESNRRKGDKYSPARVALYNAHDDFDAAIYEEGIPVVEIGGMWDINVLRRVPRSVVNEEKMCPEFIRAVRSLVWLHTTPKAEGGAA